MHLPGIYQPSNKLIFPIGNYYAKERYTKCFAFAENDKYETVKKKPVV